MPHEVSQNIFGLVLTYDVFCMDMTGRDNLLDMLFKPVPGIRNTSISPSVVDPGITRERKYYIYDKVREFG